MKIRLLRHATVLFSINNKKVLLDPIFNRAATMPPIDNSPNPKPNPLVELPLPKEELDQLLQELDAVIITHTHRDHFNESAGKLLPKNIPVFCQPEDEGKLIGLGFSTVIPVQESYFWQGIRFTRTECQHGTGEIGEKMAPASGFVLQCPGEPSLYICGDTIWCSEVEQVLKTYQPEITMVFGGAAQFLVGEPIVMDAEDIGQLCRKVPQTKVVVAHLESFNHCLLTRSQLREFLTARNLNTQVVIPENGEVLEFK